MTEDDAALNAIANRVGDILSYHVYGLSPLAVGSIQNQIISTMAPPLRDMGHRDMEEKVAALQQLLSAEADLCVRYPATVDELMPTFSPGTWETIQMPKGTLVALREFVGDLLDTISTLTDVPPDKITTMTNAEFRYRVHQARFQNGNQIGMKEFMERTAPTIIVKPEDIKITGLLS